MAALSRPGTTLPAARGRAGFRGTLSCELAKVGSVRSTYWTLGALFAVALVLGALVAGAVAQHWHQSTNHNGFDATQISLEGLLFAGQLIIAVFGALVITSEYSTGTIRTSLTVMPRRGVLAASKATAVTLVALAVTLVTSFVAFFLGQAMLHVTGQAASLSSPGALRAVIGSAVYVTLCGLFALGAGLIIRHTAGTIAAVIGILFVVPVIVGFLPQSWGDHIDRWLPSSAGDAIAVTTGTPDAHLFSGWPQLLVLAIWVAAVLIAGNWLFRLRDA